jgi:hypothetical protein
MSHHFDTPLATRDPRLNVADASLIGEGRVAMWSSISLNGYGVKAQVSRFGIPLFTQLFLSSWRQPLIERYKQVGPVRDIELFAEPVRRFVAEFSALAGLGPAPHDGRTTGPVSDATVRDLVVNTTDDAHRSRYLRCTT